MSNTNTPTFYEFAINNVARHIASKENQDKILGVNTSEVGVNAFQASEILSIVFCKNKSEIVQDIVLANKA